MWRNFLYLWFLLNKNLYNRTLSVFLFGFSNWYERYHEFCSEFLQFDHNFRSIPDFITKLELQDNDFNLS